MLARGNGSVGNQISCAEQSVAVQTATGTSIARVLAAVALAGSAETGVLLGSCSPAGTGPVGHLHQTQVPLQWIISSYRQNIS